LVTCGEQLFMVVEAFVNEKEKRRKNYVYGEKSE
jgi:hypothetical protein